MTDGAFTWMSDADRAKADAEINRALRDAGLEHEPEEPEQSTAGVPRSATAYIRSEASIERIRAEARARYGGEWGTPWRDPSRNWIHIRRESDEASVIVEQTPFGDDPLSWPLEPTYPPITLKENDR